MRRNKFKALFVAGLTTAMLLTGCSSGKDSSKDDKKTDAKQVTIKFWDFPNFVANGAKQGEYEKDMIAAFEKANPDIKVDFELIDFTDGPAKIQAAIASNTQPDVIFDAPGRIIDWARRGYLVPLDDMFTNVKKADFIPSVLKAGQVDGKTYMYPQGSAPFTMAFNKSLLEKAGLMDLLPKMDGDRTWTPEQFQKLLEGIKKKDPDIAPIELYAKSSAGDQGTRAFVANLFNSSITDKDLTKYTINDANGVKGLDWITKNYKAGLLGTGANANDANAVLDLFRQGKTAGTILYSPGLYAQDKAKNIPNFDPVFVPFPNESGKPQLEFLAAGSCIFKQSGDDAKARADASKKFIDFMANDKTWGPKDLNATGNFSPLTNGKIDTKDSELLYAETLNKFYGTYYNGIKGFAEMRPSWFPALQQALSGDKTPKAALDTFVQKADDSIKNAK